MWFLKGLASLFSLSQTTTRGPRRIRHATTHLNHSNFYMVATFSVPYFPFSFPARLGICSQDCLRVKARVDILERPDVRGLYKYKHDRKLIRRILQREAETEKRNRDKKKLWWWHIAPRT